jgi:hypothetical protein
MCDEFTAFLATLQTPAVRDLAWCCAAPSLVDDYAALGDAALTTYRLRDAAGWSRALRALDREPAPLLQFLGARNLRRLGLYYEALWHFHLQHHNAVELLAHNLPVRSGDDKRTVGEFDVLYFCRERRQVVHLELAVKFYLGLADGGGRDGWWGPDRRDRLDRKLDHLLHRQTTLGTHEAARRALAPLNSGIARREIAFRGYLFQPAEGPLPLPLGIDPACAGQRWFRYAAFVDESTGHPRSRWQILQRLEWLAPRRLQPDTAMSSGEVRDALERRFGGGDDFALLARFDQGREGRTESARCFVVSDGWPRLAIKTNAPTTAPAPDSRHRPR